MKINEIFYSLQGEGRYTGEAAVFVRFAGCNLRCDFCDTDFTSYTEMTEDEIASRVMQYPSSIVILTGGEPTLQLTSSLLTKLSEANRQVHIETNGTRPLPEGPVSWVVGSPKYAALNIRHIDELKVVYQGQDMSQYDDVEAEVYSLQPCDTGDSQKNQENLSKTINYILQHPKWKLSLQTHKLINIK